MARARRRRSPTRTSLQRGIASPSRRPSIVGLGAAERLEARQMLAVLYWDPDGVSTNNVIATGAGLGGSGTWTEAGAAVWFNPSLNGGAGGYVSWNGALGDTAVFAGTAGGTVTISGGVSAAAVEFRGPGFVVTGGSFTTATGGTTFTATAAGRFDSPIAGTGGLTKTGAAALTLGAAVSTYTGTTLVSAGLLNVGGTIQSHVSVAGGSVQGVMFYDPDLAVAVREALGVDPNTWLTPALLGQSPPLTSLTVNGNVVGDLTGIASLSALTSLELIPGDYAAAAQGISSLAPLAGLTSLTSLSLHDVGLTDAALATLPALPGLTRLDVRYNALSAVPAAVASLPRLGTLFVHGNSLLTEDPLTGLAALKGKAIDVDVAPNRPELATDVTDLAKRLYFLPLKMLEYVTNTIVFQPYTGAMKGSLATLQTKAGNDWDTNSLLTALYGAAGISTRYVAGVIEVTESQLRDYVGARDTFAAANILAAAGLGYDQYANRFKHTWLEAQVAVPATGQQSWVPIDASWKMRDYRPGLPGVLTNVRFDPLESDYLTNPEWRKKSTADYYEAKVAAWLAQPQNRPDLTIADVGYEGPVRQQSFPALPTSLPYAVIGQPAETARPTAIPDAAKYTVTIKLANGGSQLFGANGATLTLADIALSRLTIDPGLGWSGTSQTAQPILLRDGAVVATATTAISATSNLSLTITVKAPAGGTTYSRSFTRKADRFIAIGLDANQFSESLLASKRGIVNAQQLNQANGVPIDRDQAIGGLLDLAIAQYFTAANADEASLAALTSAVADRTIVALGIATSAATLSTTATAGLQFPYLPDDMGIDVPANVNGGFAIDASTTAIDLNRNLLLGYTNSALEGLVLEELTNFESVSTMKAFQLIAAEAGGISNLVEINAGNVDRIGELLPGTEPRWIAIRNKIVEYVRNGMHGVDDYAGVTFRVLVPRKPITVGGTDTAKQWNGVGYTLTCVTSDPTKAYLNGKTVGYIIHGGIGDTLISYGGAASKEAVKPPVIKGTAAANNGNNYAGDPVNVANGNVYHEETDVEIPNLGVPLAFRRRFDSINTVSGLAGAPTAWSDRGMGEGWSFTYSDRIEIAAGNQWGPQLVWFTDTGMRIEFTPIDAALVRPPLLPPPGYVGLWNNVAYTAPAGVFGMISGSLPTGFTWKDFDGNTTSFGPAVGSFCPIVSKSDRFGNGVKIDYVPGTTRIARVSDLRDANRWLSVSYNGSRISAISDFTGRTWTCTYTTDSRLQTVTAPIPAAGLAAPVVQYEYYQDAARRGLLKSVTDPAGKATSWEYYANRRGFRVTDTETLTHSFTYNLHRRQSVFIDERGNAFRYSYDEQGNLLELEQPDRTTERSTWNSRGLKLTFIDAYGLTTVFAYDTASGKVTSVTDPAGNVTTTSYTTGTLRDVDTVTRFNRPNDSSDDVATKFTYDASGFLTSQIDDFGPGRLNATTSYTPVPGNRGLMQSTVSPRGFTTSFAYNAAGQMLSQSANAAPGFAVTQSLAYDSRGNLLSRTDGNGNVTSFTFDTLGRKTSETSADPDGAGPLPAISATYAYDISGNLTSTTLVDGRVTRAAYDLRQRELRQTAADGTSTLVSYDPAGNKVTETDALGRITRYVYDARNRLVATVFPDGTSTRLRVDGGGRIVATLDQAGNTTNTAYDTLGRKVRETLPDPDGTGPRAAPVTTWAYDSRGNLASVTPFFVGQSGVAAGDAAWSTEFEYDALGRKTKETQADPDGTGPLPRPVTIFSYDANGQLVSVTDPRGFTTTYVYDQLGRKITETSPDPDGTGPLVPLVKRYVYDLAGNLRFEVAPGGANETDVSFTTEHVYDALNRRIRTTLPDPDGAGGPLARPVTTQTYDSSGRPSTLTDALGRVTTTTYRSTDRVLRVTAPDGSFTNRIYDAVGNMVFTVEAVSSESHGRRTFTTFDSLNRPIAVRSPRPDATSATPVTTSVYDVTGNLVRSTDELDRTTWRQYDALGRLTAETSPLGLFAGDPQATTRTEYDSAGRVTATIDELGRRTDTVYDSLGRKIREIGPDAGLGRPTTHYGYDAAGNLRFTTDPRGFALNDASFEWPSLAAGTFATRPAGTAWTFAGPSGISTNGSPFTAGNPAAPAGGQVLFIQGTSSATQDIAGWQAGSYVISFRTARRGNWGGVNDVRVLIDGQTVGTFKPANTSYDSFTTAPFTVTAGSHTIRLEGLAAGDNTLFIDDVRVELATPVLTDASFERPTIAGGTFSAFQIRPAGTAWTFAGDAGISANGSGFTSGNPAAPSGTQVLLLKSGCSATQDVPGWQAGSYVISFRAARRGNFGGANDFRVLIDGQAVGTFKPANTSYDSFSTAPFTVTAGSHTIRFEGINSAGGDNTAFIDDVRIELATPVLTDAGFERPTLAAGAFAVCPTGTAWSYAGHSGVTTNGNGFTSGNPAAPGGTQVMFLQATATATQDVANWQASSYVISFRAARRGNFGAAHDFRILIDGQAVGTFKPANTSYDSFTTAPFTVTAGSHTIRFEGINSAGGDNTAFIDDVRIAPARLPVSDTGFTTYLFYDALGRRTATVDALGPDWPVTALPDALPATVTTNVTRTVYDARGRVTATIDALGQTTDYGYDNLNRRISETAADPDGTGPLPRPVTRFTYDAVGNRTSVIDPLGNTTTSAYDALDRRTRLTDARGFATITTYDLAGNTTSVTDASGNVTRYAYDRLNRLITETDPLGAVSTYAYDLAGNKTKETDRLGRVTTFVYDAADRLVEERWQQSAAAGVFHTIRRIYDAASQLIGVTETDTVSPTATTAWQFVYDALGNVVKSRMAPGEIVQQPALDGVPNPPGSLAAGDLTIDWDNDGVAERYDGYTVALAVGDQLLLTTASAAFDPVLLLQRPGQGLATAFLDDHSGGGTTARLLVTADTAGTWFIAVTARDENASGAYALQIVKDQHAIVPTALVEYDFSYDKAGNLIMATEDQAAVAQFGTLGPAASGLGVLSAFAVDALNRVTRYRHAIVATGQVTKRVDYAYRADGSVGTVTRFAGAGVNPIGTSTAAYDGLGRLTGITQAPTASPAISYGYSYDAASRMTSLTTPEGTSSFTLDATDQLLSASLTSEAYAYDKTGNRTSAGTQTGSGNRLAFDGTYRYAYDAEGNRTARFRDTNAGGTLSVGDTDVTLYGYDQRNRLVAVSHVNAWTSTQAAGMPAFTAQGTPLPGSDLELRSTYDYADRRIRRMIDADGSAGAGQESVSFAAYAGDVRTLEIARPNDKIVIDSVRGPIGFLGQVVQRNFYGNGVDEILAVDTISNLTLSGTTPTTSTFWTFTDHQDSVRDIVSGNAGSLGQVVEHRQYDSFGKIVRRTNGPQATAPATSGVGIDFGYAGRPLEARTGLSDNRARWYEPATGTFINEDPSGFKGGDANLFRYVGNDPLNQVDPSGLAAKWASYAGTSSMPTGGWGVLAQQNATLPKAASPSVSAMAYASLVRQPTQAAVAASMIGMAPPAVMVSTSGGAVYSPVAMQTAGVSGSPGAGSSFMTRVGGAFSALGGLAQTGVGVSTVAASGIGTAMSAGAAAPGAIPLGLFGAGVAAHGIDQVWSGLRTVWTGSNQRPYAAQGLDFVTRNPTASDWLNGGAGMLATAGAGFATRSLAGAANVPIGVSTRLVPGGGLASHEKAGGHLLALHVGQTDAQLAARLNGNVRLQAASSFATRAEAEAAVSRAFDQNASRLASWAAQGANGRIVLNTEFLGGSVLYRGASTASPGTGARVVIQGNGAGGYYIHTGFPTR